MRKVSKLLFGCALMCSLVVCAIPTFAAESVHPAVTETAPERVTIKLFDPNDPNLISITDGQQLGRTTSVPTSHLDLRNNSPYSYSAYSAKNTMWSKYIFDNSGNHFRIQGTATNSNYKIIVHNNDNGKNYTYNGATSFDMYSEGLSGVTAPSAFYFGFDTKATGGSVSVDGEVNSY